MTRLEKIWDILSKVALAITLIVAIFYTLKVVA